MFTDRRVVSSPVTEDGQYCLYTNVKTGKKPLPSQVFGPEFTQSFYFDFDFYKVRQRWARQWTSAPPFGRRDFSFLVDQFITVAPEVFAKNGFTGSLHATGIATRENKKKWFFKTTGCNFKPDEHFVLAKLMGQELFENMIWEIVMARFSAR